MALNSIWVDGPEVKGPSFTDQRLTHGRPLGGAEHLVLYHYVAEGRLSAQIPNGKPVEITAGEVIMFPHNHSHLIGSHLDLPPVPSRQVVQAPPGGGLWVIRHGGGGEET